MKAFVPRVQCLLAAVLLAISCGAGAAADESSELRLPPDVTYSDAGASPGPVVFSHTTHAALADNKCIGCHPGLFAILRPTRGLTHAELDAGRTCGASHDGTKASGVRDACDHCHRLGGGS